MHPSTSIQQTLHLEITMGASSSEYSLWKTGKEVKGKNRAFNHSKGGLRASLEFSFQKHQHCIGGSVVGISPAKSTSIGLLERAHPENQEVWWLCCFLQKASTSYLTFKVSFPSSLITISTSMNK